MRSELLISRQPPSSNSAPTHGIILLTIAIDVFMRNKNNSVNGSSPWDGFFLSSGLLAALFGWFLGDNGYYFEEQIKIHRWSGVALVACVLSLATLYSTFGLIDLYPIHNITAIILLMVTGHFGGEMTHGQNYLFRKSSYTKRKSR